LFEKIAGTPVVGAFLSLPSPVTSDLAVHTLLPLALQLFLRKMSTAVVIATAVMVSVVSLFYGVTVFHAVPYFATGHTL
jgi:hypothetical protein